MSAPTAVARPPARTMPRATRPAYPPGSTRDQSHFAVHREDVLANFPSVHVALTPFAPPGGHKVHGPGRQQEADGTILCDPTSATGACMSELILVVEDEKEIQDL